MEVVHMQVCCCCVRSLNEEPTRRPQCSIAFHPPYLKLIEKINAISFQTSAAITDLVEPLCGKQHNARVIEQAHQQLASTKLLSDRMIEALSTTDHTATAASLVQNALQAMMVGHAKRLCSQWDLLYDSPAYILHQLHQYMKENGAYLVQLAT